MAIFIMEYIKKHIFTFLDTEFPSLLYRESILLQKDVVHSFQEAKAY